MAAPDIPTPPTFLRDGRPWDLEARKQLARRSLADLNHRQPRGIPRPPGPRGPATLLRMLRRDPGTDVFGDIARRYPRIAHARLGREHVYVLSDPDVVVAVMLTEARHTVKGKALQQAKALLGEGLLTSEGDLHKRQRNLVKPAFHRARIAGYAAEMTAAAHAHAQQWQERLANGRTELDMSADMSALTLAIVGRTLFDADLSGDAADVGRALSVVLEGFNRLLLPGTRIAELRGASWVRDLDRATGELDAMVGRMITEHRAAGDTGDLLSMLISATDAQGTMDDAQVRDETMTLVLAGHETTAMALSWAWHLLDRNPAEAAALRSELDGVLAGRPATVEDLPSLPRTRAVVAETLRIYPPAWIIGRTVIEDIVVDGWTVPAGSVAVALPWALHRDPRFWAAPERFAPARWLDDAGRFDETAPGQPRGSWFPFGWGARRCIGDQFAWTEATLVLATLAQGFAPTAAPGHVHVPVHPAVTLRPEGGMPMVLAPWPA